jgi:hypothetical protein
MLENLKFFKGSFIVTIVGLIAAFYVGGTTALFIVAVLSVLEVSLSFDNAVVNATVLKDMDEVWRRRFLTWGILIAVFGMRIVFPVLIVSVFAGVSPWGALDIAINTPDTYATLMGQAHVSLMAFGGAFLMMVGLEFFFDSEKDHWIPVIEKPVAYFEKFKFSAEVLCLVLIAAVALFALQGEDQRSFALSGVAGLVTFMMIGKLTSIMEAREEERAKHTNGAAKSGAAMFVYLEVLDASFSFDGVIGAFAISTNLFIIAIGLGIGAMFVRSLTIMLVEKDTLSEYAYLEHGAFYAIIALASMMFLKSFMHVPEVITGLIGAGFIGVAFVHSVIVNKRENTASQ